MVLYSKEWDHFLVNVARDKYWWAGTGSFFVKMESKIKEV